MSGPHSRLPQSEQSAPVSLADLVQLAEMGARSERVRVQAGGETGTVYIAQGAVVHADLGPLSGRDAAQAIFQRAESSAERLSFAEPPVRTMAVRPSQLLLSFAVESDELTRHERAKPRSGEVSGAAPASRGSPGMGSEGATEIESSPRAELRSSPGSSPRAELRSSPGTPASGSYPGRSQIRRTPASISTAQVRASGRADQGWLVRALVLFCIAGAISYVFFRFFGSPDAEETQVAPVVVEADSLTGLTDVTPRLIEAPSPKHPEGDAALQPTIICRALVGPDGLVAQAHVVEPREGMAEYEAAALKAVRAYRFKPAQRSGQVVSAWLNVPVSFAKSVQTEAHVQVRGSPGLTRLMADLAKQFAISAEETSLDYEMDGAAPCVGALLENSADICLNARPMQPFELQDAKAVGLQLQEYVVGWVHAAIIVHPINPLQELSLSQLSGIHSGKYKNWSELGGEDWPIELLGPPRDSLPADVVNASIPGVDGAPAAFPDQLKVIRDPKELLAYVARTPGAIALAQTQDVAEQTAKANDYIKPLRIGTGKGVATIADPQSIQSARYPIRSQLFAYSRAHRSESAQRFLELLFSDAGRAIAARNAIAVGPRVQLAPLQPAGKPPAVDVFHVEFIAGSVGLDTPARLRLDQVALSLAKSENRWAILIGNADLTSEPSQQDNLAKLRADVAERYLTAGGLGRGRVVVRSVGARRPRSGKVDALSQHHNRRVDVFIVER